MSAACAARFMLLYQGHAQVVESESGSFQTMTFDQWYSFSRGYEGSDVVSTVSFKIRVPKVILLLFFDRMPKKEVKFTRHNIFERDHNQCQYCGHKVRPQGPQSRPRRPARSGRRDVVGKHRLLVRAVQQPQGQPHAAGRRHMRLLQRPRRPKWRPMLHLQFSKPRATIRGSTSSTWRIGMLS